MDAAAHDVPPHVVCHGVVYLDWSPWTRSGKATLHGRAAATTAGVRCPTCGGIGDSDADFARVMKLLARWDRQPRRVDSRFAPGGRRQRWTFEESIALLDKRMRALGLRSTPTQGEE